MELPVIAAYGGCKSWIELNQDIATDGATRVLPDDVFIRKLAEFTAALGPSMVP